MTKLLLLDKDGTLIKPASGAKFVQHPEDQELLPNVAEVIARYAAEGWTMAIASNQGGCAIQKCKASDFPVGAYWISGGKPVKVIRKVAKDDQIVLHTAYPRHNGKDFGVFYLDSEVDFQYKTLEDAITEMRHCLDLLPQVDCAYFCPAFDGLTCHKVDRAPMWLNRIRQPYKACLHSFRKPEPGMLHLAMVNHTGGSRFAEVLFVGDRDEDQGAAQAAGVEFMWANEFFNGGFQ